MDFTAYDEHTGQVLFSGSASDPSLLAKPGLRILIGEQRRQGWIDPQGGFHSLGHQPDRFHEFDYQLKKWIDPRTHDQAWAAVRAQRDARLAATDWTQLPDVPLATKESWAIYRQSLREITEQPDPFNIVWPQKPIA